MRDELYKRASRLQTVRTMMDTQPHLEQKEEYADKWDQLINWFGTQQKELRACSRNISDFATEGNVDRLT